MMSMASDVVVDENRPTNKLADFLRTNNTKKQRSLVPLQKMDTNRLSNTATLDDFDESPLKKVDMKASEPVILQPVVLSPILHNSDNSGYLFEMKSGGMKTIPLYEEDEGEQEEEDDSIWRERSSTMHDHDEVITTDGEPIEKKNNNHLHGEVEEEEEVLPGLLTSDDLPLIVPVNMNHNHVSDASSSLLVNRPSLSQLLGASIVTTRQIPSQIPSQIIDQPSQNPSQMLVDLDASVVMVEGDMEPWSCTGPDVNDDGGVDVGTNKRVVTDFIPPSTSPYHDQLSPSHHHTSPSSSLSSSSTLTSSTRHDISRELNINGAANADAFGDAIDDADPLSTIHYPSPSSHHSHNHTAVSPSGYIEFIPPPPPLPLVSTTVSGFGTGGAPGGTCKRQGLGPFIFFSWVFDSLV